MRILIPMDSNTELGSLIDQLRSVGIPVGAGAILGDGMAAITFAKPADTDRAIAWLANEGITATRG